MSKQIANIDKFDMEAFLASREEVEIEEYQGAQYKNVNKLQICQNEEQAEKTGVKIGDLFINVYVGGEGKSKYEAIHIKEAKAVFIQEGKKHVRKIKSSPYALIGETTIYIPWSSDKVFLSEAKYNKESKKAENWEITNDSLTAKNVGKWISDNRINQEDDSKLYSTRMYAFGALDVSDLEEEEQKTLNAMYGWAPILIDLSGSAYTGKDVATERGAAFKNPSKDSYLGVIKNIPKIKNPDTNREVGGYAAIRKGAKTLITISSHKEANFIRHSFFLSQVGPEEVAAGIAIAEKEWLDNNGIGELSNNVLVRAKYYDDDSVIAVKEVDPIKTKQIEAQVDPSTIPGIIPEKTQDDIDDDIEAAFDM